MSVDGTYLGDLLPGFLLIGVALGFSFVPISIAALAGVEPAEAGLASGLINTSQQIGGALGIAALSAVAINLTTNAVEGGAAQPVALVDGFQGAFWAAAGRRRDRNRRLDHVDPPRRARGRERGRAPSPRSTAV